MKKFPAKAQRRKESFRCSLRLCAFAGNSFGLVILLLCGGVPPTQAKTRTNVKISIPTTSQIKVEAELSAPLRSWSFRNAYAGALGMAERVEDFRAFGESGQDGRARKSATGEFRAEFDATKISYIVKLSTPQPAEVPYTTWLDGDRGFLMFADLVPFDLESLCAEFVLPSGWTVESSITPDANGRYVVSTPEKSVFFVGRSLRKASKSVDGMMLEFVINGKWRFKDDDVLKAASAVMQKYLALTGFRLPGKSVIMIAPAPVSLGKSTWKAETRGSSVVVLLDPAHSDNWFAQIRVLLVHEILHLWVPNSLNLEGDYDWFFEGFTLYMAVRTAVELKITDFKGFLIALSGVYDSYLSQPDPLSLIEESERRWANSSTHVYYKGVLVAFLYDLLLRKESAGKVTLADRYRDLFNGTVADGANGNEAIIRLLGVSPATRNFTKSFIESSRELKLEQLVSAYGLQLDRSGKKSELKVSSRLDQDQKQLLRSLGY